LPVGLLELIKLNFGHIEYTGPDTLVQFSVKNISAGESKDDLITVDITLQRMFYYQLAATYLPTTCLLIIAEVNLFVDESHFEATIMVSLTAMLVMYTLYQGLATSLPQTAYLKMIDIWLLFCLIMPFFVFMVLVMWELQKDKDGIMEWNSNEKSMYGTKKPSPKTKSSTMRDWCGKRCVQWFIIIFTAFFFVIYWMIAMIHYYVKQIKS